MKAKTIAAVLGVLFWIVFMAILGFAALTCGGCAHRRMIVPPVNPDVPAVVAPVARAAVSNARASESAARAVQIVEKIIAAPGQEKLIADLKLELTTTVEQLKLTSADLDAARARLTELTRSVDDMKTWGLNQQLRADHAEAAWVRADKAVWNRNKLILLQWLILVALTLWLLKGPLLRLARGAVLP